ncbi:hypothetical protein SBDP2_540002 [Syntrophobacter sp. SbD2]|nr:hypothetical protein SBDP2_540002 [Syntrophobacter sp. SbD2]
MLRDRPLHLPCIYRNYSKRMKLLGNEYEYRIFTFRRLMTMGPTLFGRCVC